MTIQQLLLLLAIALAVLFLLCLVSYTLIAISVVVFRATGLRLSQSQTRRLSPRRTAWLKGLHVLSCAAWVGAAASITVLALVLKPSAESPQALHAANMAVKLLDDALIVPGAVTCVFTGVLLGLLTSYSFTRFYWIVVKTVLALWSLVFGLFILRPWIDAVAEASRSAGPAALQDLGRQCCTPANMVVGFIQFALLVGLIFISVLKPWRRIQTEEPND
jgi:uncharacterized membrane protein